MRAKKKRRRMANRRKKMKIRSSNCSTKENQKERAFKKKWMKKFNYQGLQLLRHR